MTKQQIETRLNTLMVEEKELERQLMEVACSSETARIKTLAIKEKIEEMDTLKEQLNTI